MIWKVVYNLLSEKSVKIIIGGWCGERVKSFIFGRWVIDVFFFFMINFWFICIV